MPFTLIVEAGPQTGQVFSLEAKAVLGRGQFADVQISDLAVSRRHAEIDPEADGWQFRDLDSANGSRCNGRALQAPIRLRDGDLIELGQTRLRVRLDTVAAPQPALDDPLETLRPPDPPAPSSPSSPVVAEHPPLPRTAAVDDAHLLAIPRLQALARLGAMAAASGPANPVSALALLAECFPRCQRFAWFPGDDDNPPLATLGLPPSELPWARRCSAAAIDQQALLCNDSGFSAAWAEAAPHTRPTAWAALPLRRHGAVLGAVYFDSIDTASAIRAQDQTFIEGLSGAMAALLPSPASVAQSPAATTATLQLLRLRQLPASAPTLAGYTISVRPGDQSAALADRYDFLRLADGSLALLLCSPLGAGIASEIMLARLGAYARALAPRARAPSDLLAQLNRLARTEFDDSVPITALLAAFDPQSHQVSLASAGQALPWVGRGADGCTEAVLEPGPALGQSGQPNLHEALIEIPPNGGMVLFGRRFPQWIDPGREGSCAAAARRALATASSANGALALIDQARAASPPASPDEAPTLIAVWRR